MTDRKLTFPTQAEQCLAEFNAATKTIALVTLAKRRGATVERNGTVLTYTFDDDTSLVASGHGKNWKVTAELP